MNEREIISEWLKYLYDKRHIQQYGLIDVTGSWKKVLFHHNGNQFSFDFYVEHDEIFSKLLLFFFCFYFNRDVYFYGTAEPFLKISTDYLDVRRYNPNEMILYDYLYHWRDIVSFLIPDGRTYLNCNFHHAQLIRSIDISVDIYKSKFLLSEIPFTDIHLYENGFYISHGDYDEQIGKAINELKRVIG